MFNPLFACYMWHCQLMLYVRANRKTVPGVLVAQYVLLLGHRNMGIDFSSTN